MQRTPVKKLTAVFDSGATSTTTKADPISTSAIVTVSTTAAASVASAVDSTSTAPTTGNTAVTETISASVTPVMSLTETLTETQLTKEEKDRKDQMDLLEIDIFRLISDGIKYLAFDNSPKRAHSIADQYGQINQR